MLALSGGAAEKIKLGTNHPGLARFEVRQNKNGEWVEAEKVKTEQVDDGVFLSLSEHIEKDGSEI